MLDLLRLESVTFGYTAALPILRGVTLALAPGEMVGLLGPNGAGKTTLMRLASGALAPQSGQVRFQDRPLSAIGRRAVAQQIAVVPQDLAVTFAFTVRQMVEMGRTPHLPPLGWGMLRPADRAIVDDALRQTGLRDLADRVFADLSGGERQRVLVAMALAQSPTLLLLDEPTAHLDIHHQIEVLELVAQLNRETGVTVLASMHDLNLAARYFPRLILFQRGIVADGPPSTALAPDLLAQVYQTPVQVGILRGARHLSVAPPSDAAHDLHAPPTMHVIAGGGTGDLVMRALTEAGIPFSTGALNIGDSDADLAQHLAVDVIHEPPYAPVSAGGRAATLAALLAAGGGILAPSRSARATSRWWKWR